MDDTVAMLLADCGRLPPLSAEDERVLLARRPDLEAVELLVKSNIRLLVRISRQYMRDGHRLEDLLSAAIFGYLEGIRRWEDVGHRLNTYAIIWARKELRAMSGGRMTHSLEVTDAAQVVVVPTYESDEIAKMVAAILHLPPILQTILQQRFFDGKTLREVADGLGYSYQYIGILEHRALAMLKGMM